MPGRCTRSTVMTPGDGRNVRCSCGFRYNGYRWPSCPVCEANERGLYALLCTSCRHNYYTAEPEDHCPECDSGETRLLVAPDEPAVR